MRSWGGSENSTRSRKEMMDCSKFATGARRKREVTEGGMKEMIFDLLETSLSFVKR